MANIINNFLEPVNCNLPSYPYHINIRKEEIIRDRHPTTWHVNISNSQSTSKYHLTRTTTIKKRKKLYEKDTLQLGINTKIIPRASQL